MVARFSGLSPTSDSQKKLLGAIGADEAQIQQTRLLMSLQLASPISWPLLVVVASWSIALLWVRNPVETERHDPRRLSPRFIRYRQRDIPHSRIERAL
jgi:hypothetical protein